jgi:hypothetical protein
MKNMLSHKMDRAVGIIRMEESLVPLEYVMEVTSHMEPISYGK